MKIFKKYSLNEALIKIEKKGNILQELEAILNDSDLRFSRNSTRKIKKSISIKFNSLGWGDNIKLLNTRLTISFLKSEIGLCFQIGNVARTYADVLKLAYLIKKGLIDVAIIIVPMKNESKELGTNYANYERLKTEMELFQEVINVPILLLGLSN